MARKRVGGYALFHDVDGTASVNVHYAAGGADTIHGLPVDEAEYIVELLREEEPVDYDHDRRRFMSGLVEPVGEGEGGSTAPFFRLENWIGARAWLADAIVWEEPGGSLRRFADWPASDRAFLERKYLDILGDRAPGVPALAPLARVPDPGESVTTLLARGDAWLMYVGHVAQSLAVEACTLAGWSVRDYPLEQRELLFSSRSLFHWSEAEGAYAIPFSLGAATPGDPYRTWQFVRGASLLRPTRAETLGAVIDWCRANLVHFTGGWDAENVEDQWQYRGLPPVERIIAGTPRTSEGSGTIRHRTGGCWGTTGFLRAVLRTINIPAKLEQRGGHALPHFMPDELFLTHGDDPYNALFRTMPWVPGRDLTIGTARWTEWFGPGEPHLDNVGRQVRELSIEHLPYWLLRRHCEDLTAGLSHADSRVFETFERNYSVAELEAMDLWTRMDARIAELGGCASVPAG